MLHGTASLRRLLLRLQNAPKRRQSKRRGKYRQTHLKQAKACPQNITSPLRVQHIPPLYNIYCSWELRSPAE